MRGLLWIVAFAACGGQSGVQISALEMGTGAKTVRIFVGAGLPATHTITIDQTTFSGADTWFRDPGVDDVSEKVSGGSASFFFESSGAPTQLPIAIAVGFDDNGTAVGAGELMAVDVPGSGLLHYDLPLVSPPANMLTWDKGGSKTTAVANKCVGFGEHLIVASEDQDCDGNIDGTPQECQPDVYQGALRTAIPGELTCLTDSSAAGPSGPSCFAGGPTCTDGTGPQGTCVASSYCASPTVCNACRNMPFECAETGTAGTVVAIPRFECVISIKHSGDLCGDDVVLPKSTQTNCSNVQLRSGQQNFQPTLSVDRGNTSLSVGSASNGCEITLSPTGTVDVTTPNGADPVKAVMAVDTGTYQGFLVPIVFSFAMISSSGSGGGCSATPSHCTASVASLVTDATSCNIITPGG